MKSPGISGAKISTMFCSWLAKANLRKNGQAATLAQSMSYRAQYMLVRKASTSASHRLHLGGLSWQKVKNRNFYTNSWTFSRVPAFYVQG
jgi:hypothetical protein